MSDTTRTDDLRREINALPKFGQYGYSVEKYAELVFKRFADMERELAAERQLKERVEAEAEQLRVQLAGCGVAAMGNTRTSLARNKQVKQGDYGYSASYADCLTAAEREINERERAEKAEAELAVMSKRAQRMAQQCSLEHARWKQEEWRRENLESELAAVKEDAERFRWLRDEWFVSGKDFPWADYEIATNDQLNDAIDEQRKS